MNPLADISGLAALWQQASGGDPGIRIAIIDGPVDLSHPALSGARVTVGGQFVAPASPIIRSEHGTHITSVIMGVPGSPVLGVAPNCTATVLSIYRENANGELEPSSQATLALAINQALADGADVINISSGQQTPTGQADRILADAVRACSDAGKLIVAAAGNDGCRCVQVPGSLESVLAVGACDLAGNPLPFSNFGDPYLDNGILAPGENVTGASPIRHVALRSGTSFAAPIVTGVVALLLSCLRQSGREADPQAVRAALLASAAPCDDGTADVAPRCLAGRLDISGAVAALLGQGRDSTKGTSPSNAAVGKPRRLHDVAETVRSSVQPQFAAQSTATREGSMGELSATSALSIPRILGPDGNAVRSGAGLLPSEVHSGPPATATTAPADYGAGAASAATAAPQPHTPPMGGDVVWVPMTMSSGGAVPNGWAPMQVPAVMPSGAPSPAAMRPSVPARYEAAPSVRTSEAGCGCGVRPAEAATDSRVQMAFPVGRLFYDFGKEARLDYFVQSIASWRDSLAGRGNPVFGTERDRSGDTAAPYNPGIMARYLLNQPEGETSTPAGLGTNFPDADAMTWTLTIDAIPIYAIKPLDVFGLGFYAALILALWHQEVSHEDPAHTQPIIAASAEGTPPAPRESFPGRGGVARVSMAGWTESTNTTRLLARSCRH
jgi:cyanobactin maturation PatA/PatG family protease